MPNTDPYSGSFTIPDQLYVDAISFDGDLLTISGCVRGSEAHCPVCGRPSRRVHGRYTRTLADLPWSGTPVRLRVGVRKFFCDQPTCERRIFAERLPDVARVHARGTDRQREALEWVAFALGGEAGARLARELGLLVSPDTLLNRIRGASRAEATDVRVLGVDDFGFKRGNASGTIMVDLERHEIVDLLQGHSTELIARWLRKHPGLEVVGRDRSNICREGIETGAPQARQVADRWHLLHNLTQVLEEFLLTKRPALKKATMPEETGPEEPGTSEDGSEGPVPTTEIPMKRPYESIEGPAKERHERLVEQWKEIRRLHLAGARVKDISEWTGTSRSTVYRYRQLAEPPPRPEYRRKKSVLDPWMPYLVALERGLPQRQAAPRGDPGAGLLPQHRHGEQAALQLQIHRRAGEKATCSQGEEGQHCGSISFGQERGRAVHAPRGEAKRGAEGVPGQAVRLRRGTGRCPAAYARVCEDGPEPRRREIGQMARRSRILGGGSDEEVRRWSEEGFVCGEGGTNGKLEHRTSGGLHPQDKAHKAAGLRSGKPRPLESQSAGGLKTAPED
jgi:zinc-finger of transposase IS204/IS1001/IS1096/IS1165/Transposase/Helix-turn-helix domain of resolvase